MPKFTVWFRVGLDFKETIEAESISDAQRKLEDKVDEEFPDYVARIHDDPITFIYDIAEELPNGEMNPLFYDRKGE